MISQVDVISNCSQASQQGQSPLCIVFCAGCGAATQGASLALSGSLVLKQVGVQKEYPLVLAPLGKRDMFDIACLIIPLFCV